MPVGLDTVVMAVLARGHQLFLAVVFHAVLKVLLVRRNDSMLRVVGIEQLATLYRYALPHWW